MQVPLDGEPQRPLAGAGEQDECSLHYDSEWLGILKSNNSRIPRTFNKNLNTDVQRGEPLALDNMQVLPFSPEPGPSVRSFAIC